MAAKLASSMKVFHHKPDISRAQIDALFEKHDFSLSRSITHLESNSQIFRSSYKAVIGQPPTELSAVEEKVLSIIKNLRQVRFFWDCGRLLHPKTPEYVGAAITDLESLHGYTG